MSDQKKKTLWFFLKRTERISTKMFQKKKIIETPFHLVILIKTLK